MRNKIQVNICRDIKPYEISATLLVLMVCDNCGINQNWKNGNSYTKLWNQKKTYCDN